jgi:3-oxoacyl-[acyl-carrier-protein] synthase III
MRFDGIWITGTGSARGDLVPLREAAGNDQHSAVDAADSGMVSVAQSQLPAEELAVRAGQAALRQAEANGSPAPEWHFHGASYGQHVEGWSAASAVSARLLGPTFPGLCAQVSAMSNSSLAMLELAATMLIAPGAGTGPRAALLTAADSFHESAVNRWGLDRGMVLGDGAASAVVTAGREGPLRLRSCASYSEAGMSDMHAGADGAEGDEPGGVLVGTRVRTYLERSGQTTAAILDRSAAGVRRVASRALTDAGCETGDIRWFVPPFVGRRLCTAHYAVPLGFDPASSLLGLGLTVGHMLAADQLFGLDHLLRNDKIKPGDLVMLIGEGVGLTFSCAIVEGY